MLGRDGVMLMCAHVYDLTLCGNTANNVAFGLFVLSTAQFIVSPKINT